MVASALKLVPTLVETLSVPSARAAAVAQFRELADRLEAGELEGARVEWRSGYPYLTYVELDYARQQVRMRQVRIEETE